MSFHTAKALRGRIEMLPKVPDWKSKKITLPGYVTREPMYLFFRDALDCTEYLFGNPLFAGHMDFSPTQSYRDAEQTIRIYSEWMTGEAAWNMQVRFSVLFIFSHTVLIDCH